MGIASEVSVFRDGRKDWAADEGGSSALFSAPDAQSLGPPLRCSDTFDDTIL